MAWGIRHIKITPLLGSHFTFPKANANITEAHFPNNTFSTLLSQGTCKSGLSGDCIPPEGQALQNNQALKEKLELKGDREQGDLSCDHYLLKISSSSPPQPQ